MYGGAQNETENQAERRQVWSEKRNKNDIELGSVTGGPLQACFYLLEVELNGCLPDCK